MIPLLAFGAACAGGFVVQIAISILRHRSRLAELRAAAEKIQFATVGFLVNRIDRDFPIPEEPVYAFSCILILELSSKLGAPRSVDGTASGGISSSWTRSDGGSVVEIEIRPGSRPRIGGWILEGWGPNRIFLEYIASYPSWDPAMAEAATPVVEQWLRRQLSCR